MMSDKLPFYIHGWQYKSNRSSTNDIVREWPSTVLMAEHCVNVCRPIHDAVEADSISTVHLLLCAGADVTMKKYSGESVFHLAKSNDMKRFIQGRTQHLLSSLVLCLFLYSILPSPMTWNASFKVRTQHLLSSLVWCLFLYSILPSPMTWNASFKVGHNTCCHL